MTNTQWDAHAGDFAPKGGGFTYIVNEDGRTRTYIAERGSSRSVPLNFPEGLTSPSGNPKCIAAKIISPLKKGESVEVQRMAPEDACAADMLVLIRWQGRTMAVPLSQLAAVDPDDSTAEAIADWHYWVAQGYCF